MSSEEYKDLKCQMERIERMLARLMGEQQEEQPAPLPAPPTPRTPDMTEQERVKSIQEEGHYILATQGFAAYKQFWQEQSRKSKKPRLRRAA